MGALLFRPAIGRRYDVLLITDRHLAMVEL